MTAYYNDNDAFCVQWLRNLIAAGLIAPGEVDDRDIRDVRADDLVGFSQAHFFAGIGGWSFACRLAGWPDDRPVWTGSCPCQPFSQAGLHRGFDDERHLWPAWFDLIRECRPVVVVGEQVAHGGAAWLDLVHTDMEAEGYAVGAVDLPAGGSGFDHIRQRLYWVAHADGAGFQDLERRARPTEPPRGSIPSRPSPHNGIHRWSPEPEGGWVVHGLSANVDAVRAYGNAIVPQVAAEFIGAVMECCP